VVLLAASFLFLPEIVAHSDFVALVPRRLVQGRADRLQLVECPFPVAGFSISLLWHERNHAHAAHRWVRERLTRVTAVA
jgi:DNA-binding transcriptional LysR family regulator